MTQQDKDREQFEQLVLHVWGPEPIHPQFAEAYNQQKQAAYNWYYMGQLSCAPMLTEKDAAERAAEAFCRSTDVYDPSAMVVALRAAGLRFKEEA